MFNAVSWFQYGYNASIRRWEVLPAEDCVKHFREKGYRALWYMSQDPVWDTVQVRSLAELESHDGLQDLGKAGEFQFICGSILV
jgi:hypothetical protein